MPSDVTRPASPQAPQIVHEPLLPLYASQFVLTGNEEHLMVDCAPAVLSDAVSGRPTLPVHTRLVLSWNAAQRLSSMLAEALKQHELGPPPLVQRPSAAPSPAAPLAAQLPRLEA